MFRRRPDRRAVAALAPVLAAALAEAALADAGRRAAAPPSLFAPEVLRDRDLFARAYVLARASVSGGSLNGQAAAAEALKAWEEINGR